MLSDEIVVAALAECVAPRGEVLHNPSYHFAFAQAVDALAEVTDRPRDHVEADLKLWLESHDGAMVAAHGVRESLEGPLALIRFASLPADRWQGLCAEHGLDGLVD